MGAGIAEGQVGEREAGWPRPRTRGRAPAGPHRDEPKAPSGHGLCCIEEVVDQNGPVITLEPRLGRIVPRRVTENAMLGEIWSTKNSSAIFPAGESRSTDRRVLPRQGGVAAQSGVPHLLGSETPRCPRVRVPPSPGLHRPVGAASLPPMRAGRTSKASPVLDFQELPPIMDRSVHKNRPGSDPRRVMERQVMLGIWNVHQGCGRAFIERRPHCSTPGYALPARACGSPQFMRHTAGGRHDSQA